MSRPLYHTPLARWKALAKIENARARGRNPAPAGETGTPPGSEKRLAGEALCAEVSRLYHEERCCVSEISRVLDIEMHRVWRILRLVRSPQGRERLAMVSQIKARKSTPPRDETSVLAEQLAAVFRIGLSPEQVAERKNIPEAAVWRAFGTWLRAEKAGSGPRKTPARFYHMRLRRMEVLTDAGMSRTEAAAQIGVTLTALRNDEKRLNAMGAGGGEPLNGFRQTGRMISESGGGYRQKTQPASGTPKIRKRDRS